MKHALLSFLLCMGAVSFAKAQAFTYRPINPNFGGYYFNSSGILSSAQSQDRNTDPTRQTSTSTTTTNTNSTLDNFASSIQSQILQRISSQLVGNQFGESTLKEGTYTFGTFQVTIRNATEGVVVRVVDSQGGETSVTVPYF